MYTKATPPRGAEAGCAGKRDRQAEITGIFTWRIGFIFWPGDNRLGIIMRQHGPLQLWHAAEADRGSRPGVQLPQWGCRRRVHGPDWMYKNCT